MAAGCITPRPGRRMTSTPQKPTATAAQRRGPTRSPSSGTESAVTASGVSASMAWTSARGMRPKHQTTRPISSTRRQERKICSRGRAERSERPIPPGQSTSRTIGMVKT